MLLLRSVSGSVVSYGRQTPPVRETTRTENSGRSVHGENHEFDLGIATQRKIRCEYSLFEKENTCVHPAGEKLSGSERTMLLLSPVQREQAETIRVGIIYNCRRVT